MNKIRLWWKFEGRYYHKDFIHGIKNLFKWFKIIYKDRNWDHRYIFDILQHKLKLQAKYIGDRDIHTRAKRDAWVMNLCCKLIDKVKNEYYEMEYMDYHKSRMDFLDIPDKPDLKKLDIVELSESFDDYFKKYPLIYKQVIRLGEKNIFPIKYKEDKKKIAMNIGFINHKRAKKLLFKILEQNVEGFWD